MNLGQEGEQLVVEKYQELGFKVIGRNYRIHFTRQVGELDLVAVKDKLIAFVEVKTRQSETFGQPAEAVGRSKQLKLIKMAKLFMMQNDKYSDYDYRIDVAAVRIDNGRHFVTILANVIEDFN